MYRLKTVSVWHVRNRSNRFAGGRLFTVNNLSQVKCNLYHSYSRWCRKACRCLREILTYRDQRSRCVIKLTLSEILTIFITSSLYTNIFYNSFFPSTIRVWNDLPEDLWKLQAGERKRDSRYFERSLQWPSRIMFSGIPMGTGTQNGRAAIKAE